jgi:dinuclear metal center YbgI/SA1388 family protein
LSLFLKGLAGAAVVESKALISYLDELLRLDEIADVSQNGLQVQCPDEIDKVGFAVDAAQAIFKAAADKSVQLLVVHHGLYWKDVQLAIDAHYRRLKVLFEAKIGLYAAHLPLDAHDEVGNNRCLAELLELVDDGPFGVYKGVKIGRLARSRGRVTRENLRELLDKKLGTSTLLLPFGPNIVKKICIVSGGGADILPQAVSTGCDTFVTGEQVHEAYHIAREGRINLYMAGHYATETVGLKALQKRVSGEFGVETVFIEFPTGL